MKVSKLLGQRFKETPKDCVIESHKLMTKGGYIKYLSSGIYSLFTPTKRITNKIEKIIREEMDKIDGQEVLFPVVMPASLWEESGRYQNISNELIRFEDRNNAKMVLGMTHEEASVHLARETAKSYTDFPFMIYQIQTKFRDEKRPRAGLIRVREFTMKDAYSFHTSYEDLQNYYEKCHIAYDNIFRRAGAKNVACVAGDSGMMGGKVSHEYMLINPAGEDSIVECTCCDYKANLEVATCIVDNSKNINEYPLSEIHTPNLKTIDEVSKFLKTTKKYICKAVVFTENVSLKHVVVFIRGDVEVNITKLKNYLGKELFPAETIDTDSNLVPGFIGPVGLNTSATVIFDTSLKGCATLVAGANKEDYHLRGVNLQRDLGNINYVDVGMTFKGAICPKCKNESVNLTRGIEIGNIFQLGTKYTESMKMTYVDSDGQNKNPIMGCYGIGVGRLLASICEEQHDDYGPIWPITIAPWQVQICCLQANEEETRAQADKLYENLVNLGIEVLYDDRQIRPGAMFADADLFGIPVRVVVSKKCLEKNIYEVSFRDKSYKGEVSIDDGAIKIQKIVMDLLSKHN